MTGGVDVEERRMRVGGDGRFLAKQDAGSRNPSRSFVGEEEEEREGEV